jgi:amphiphysin
MLKSEIPHFLALSTSFITPLFQSYYFIQIGILCTCSLARLRFLHGGCVRRAHTVLTNYSLRADTLLEKMQSFSTSTYGADAGDVSGLESFRAFPSFSLPFRPFSQPPLADFEKMGDTQERIEALTITKRITSTARLVSQHRSDSGSTLGRASSNASSFAARPGAVASSSSYGAEAAPPAYGAAPGAATPLAGKRAPPPPPGRPGAKKVETVTALYDFAAQVRLLSFLSLSSPLLTASFVYDRAKATFPSPPARRSKSSSGPNRRTIGGPEGTVKVGKERSRRTTSRRLERI